MVKQGAGEHGECGEGVGAGGIRGDVGYHLAVDVHGYLRRRGPVFHLHRQYGGGDIRPSLGGGGNQIVFPLRLGSVSSGAGGSGVRPGHRGPVGTGERAGHRPQHHQGADGGQSVHHPAGGVVQVLHQPAGREG